MHTPLQRLGVETEVACCDAPDAPWLDSCGFQVHALGPPRSGYGYTSDLVPWLRTNAGRFDAVIVHGIWQYHSLAVRHALRSSGIPYFVYTHGMLDPWFKRAYPLKHLKKWLYWPWAEYRVLRDARAVLFTCEEERLLARQSFWLYRCNEAVVNYGTALPSGNMEVQRELFLGKYPELRGKRLFLFLSRIHPKKGCDLLIEAFARVAALDTDLHLVLTGPDQVGWQSDLMKLSERLGVSDRITWTGMLSGDLKWGAYHAAEAFVLPSHQENFGIVVAESLVTGTPVLISNKVNIWREIEGDGAGLMAEDTVEATFALLHCWLHLRDEERIEMGQRAKGCFARHFEITRAAKGLLEVIKGAI